MKAAPFRYARPSTIQEAVELKAQFGDEAHFLAGGQSLLPALNMRLDHPRLLIDVNGLSELKGISVVDGSVHIGAITRTQAVATSDLIASRVPLLREAGIHIAHPAIRNLGTFGGSVALADPAGEWPACCLALDARMVMKGPTGERTVEAREFFQGLFTTAMAPDELLLRVELPAPPPDAKVVAVEICRRKGDFAIVGLLLQARLEQGGRLGEPRAVFFGVADRPVRLAAVEEALAGRDRVARAQAAVEGELSPLGDLYHQPGTKKHLAKVLLARAVDCLTH